MASCLSACVGGPGPQPGVNARRAGGKDTASPPPPPFSTRHQIANGYLDLDSSSRHRRSVVSCSAAAAAGEQGGDRIAGRRGAPGGRKAGRQPTNQRRARGGTAVAAFPFGPGNFFHAEAFGIFITR